MPSRLVQYVHFEDFGGTELERLGFRRSFLSIHVDLKRFDKVLSEF